jgi:hypothetical protein
MTITSPQHLHALATHFAQEDWEYTRNTHIKHIRYDDDYAGYDAIPKRLKRAFGSLFHPRKRDMFSDMIGAKHWWHRLMYKLVYFRIQMETDKHRPDGTLHRGCIITHWEEDGEYIQMVQPSVGALLAEFLMEEPDNPHAQKITAELDRLWRGYSERARAGEVAGTTS